MTSSSSSAPDASGHQARTPAPLRKMSARPRDESHRVATPLELFFDLCFVVAVSQAGVQLVHAIAGGHEGEGLLNYAMVFFSIWWAWMNFSWFASAYDNDDALYRVVTLVQIAGVLVLAAGISKAFEHYEFLAVWSGYAIMRFALTAQWLRVARSTSGVERRTALRYGAGIMTCQVGWLGLLVLPQAARGWVFLVMAVAEMCVPPFAEREQRTAWHPHHISERYGLFTIIVLGETVAGATVAVKSALDEGDTLGRLLPIATGGLLIVFAAWWIYFVVPIHGHLRSNRQAFLWGYGHYLIFAAAAAIGAGIEIAVEQATGEAHVSQLEAAATVTIPAALFLIAVWALHARYYKVGTAQQLVLPVSSLAILACTFTGRWAIFAAGVVAALTVATGVTLTTRMEAAEARGTNGGDSRDTPAA